MKIFAKTLVFIISGVLTFAYLAAGLMLGSERAMAESCSVPTLNYLYDGLGTDVNYFNKKNQISANWKFNDNGCPITEYKFRVIKGAGITSWQQVTDWLSTVENQARVILPNLGLPSLVGGETYFFKVMARNSAGWSEKYKTDGQMLDTLKPQINSFSLLQDKPYGEKVTLSWSTSDIGSGIKNYQIYRNGAPLGSILDKSVLSYADTIFGDNLTYAYYVIAIDEAGNYSSRSMTLFAAVDNIAPAAPSISYWIGGGKIIIFWPTMAGVSAYKVYRNGALVQSGTDATYADTGIIKGQTYSYVVYAFDVAGNGSFASNTLEIYVPKPRVSSTATSQVLGALTGAEQVQAALEGVKTD
ncbi:MAG: fibronectin type III domain-containing protein, partial [Candidatus Berkelbacteria bacterium Licking1014_96]